MDVPGVDIEWIKQIFGEAASGEFGKTLAIFSVAAFVHARQVRKEIKEQFGELVAVLKDDLHATKEMMGRLGERVDKIEEHLKIKGD